MSTPTVPQRPTRSQNPPSSTSSTDPSAPQVPPRPTRNIEKSKSPHRDYGVRSPLNTSPFAAPGHAFTSTSNGVDDPPSNLEKRPSIASLPLVGNEGIEYDSLDKVPQLKDMQAEPSTPKDTRSVSGDLPLHAPTASAGGNSRAKVAPVVRTDSATAAGLGLGKAPTHDDDASELRLAPTISRSREHRPLSSSGLSRDITSELSRPVSHAGQYEDEEEQRGIPHIGSHVPMYPNAGDVQAPSPAPWQGQQSTGVGFFNDSSRSPEPPQGRRKSAIALHQDHIDTYGLHGHGQGHQSKFEKSWYEKHPEELKKEEHGIHGSASMLDRPEWALSSDDLNKLVRGSSQGGFATSDGVIGVPTEAIGHALTAKYTSRDASPALQPTKSQSSGGDPENDKIHIESSAFQDRYTQQGKHQAAEEIVRGRDTATPIFASDEVARGSSQNMQPAVSPEAQKHAHDEYFSDSDSHLPAWQRRQHTGSGRSSRRNSRPNSAAFYHHEPHSTGTPLNEIDEYEPLFKDEDNQSKQKRPVTAADRLKRPELERRFPSQDIWEDTPNSLRLETTVGGPQEPEEKITSPQGKNPGNLFESPDAEKKRQGEITESERRSFLDDSQNMVKAKPKYNAGVAEERHRPGMGRRFVSRDVWEDTPDSLRLETTVAPEDTELKSPTGGSAPAANNLAQGFAAADKSMAAPEVPARPSRSKGAGPTEKETLDNQPDPTKAKPEVPARPARSSHAAANDGAPMSKVTSGGSNSSATEVTSPTEGTTTKTKPTVPSKPAQAGKFASIKAGFMNDLNSRLQLGPQAHKPKQEEQSREIEEEKAPLADARKSRAKGPARRQPQPTASSAAASPEQGPSSWGFSTPKTHWSINDTGLSVHGSSRSANNRQSAPAEEAASATHSPADATSGTSLNVKNDAPTSASPGTEKQARQEELDQLAKMDDEELERIGADGDLPKQPPAALEKENAPGAAGGHEVFTGETITNAKEDDAITDKAAAFVDQGNKPEENLLVKDGQVSEALEDSQAAG